MMSPLKLETNGATMLVLTAKAIGWGSNTRHLNFGKELICRFLEISDHDNQNTVIGLTGKMMQLSFRQPLTGMNCGNLISVLMLCGSSEENKRNIDHRYFN